MPLSLELLNLSHNQMTSLPLSLYKVTSLNHLNLSYNLIEGLQPGLGNLVQLHTIHLNNNQLDELPDSISMLKNLKGKYNICLLTIIVVVTFLYSFVPLLNVLFCNNTFQTKPKTPPLTLF